ncbi:MAG: hypothetical protein CMP53_08600 [Flavobacteriales bacterium]|nr:hypothetical protein [Flavobacteriales bacterium]|tara:strand:+ start:106 stop:4047 length:3942 start_codon:yes stop_codon:yes gene_type:complete
MFRKPLALLITLVSIQCGFAQVAITNYSVNSIGQAQLSIQGQAGKYYLLHAQHSSTFNWVTSITMGVSGTMVISEPGTAYPLTNYSITEHDISNPGDWDGDGIDDITEYQNMPTDAPLNYAPAVAFIDGATSIPDAQTFMSLATVNNVGWAPFLDNQLYVKFGILNRDGPNPQIYFINSNTHTVHFGFWGAINANVIGDDSSGEIVYNPNVINPNGVIGSYSFNFSFGDAYNFQETQRTYELLMANMPFLQNNMNHFIGSDGEDDYNNIYASGFTGARFEVVLESDVFADINYIPFHEAEGYGYFKEVGVGETPGSRDIVLYNALPNSLPRVGGIITSVIQTPLSHVNLRAIQDNVPNAYIKDPLSIDSIANLLNSYIYYKAENETFQIRSATLQEVNDWYDKLRPTNPQIPVRDLSIERIMPLDSIAFAMSAAFGAKCANVATMRTFGFPTPTIPNGFGVPFYYYDEFMKHNDFYNEAQVMMTNPVFINDIDFRKQRLKDFRKDIKAANMPQWMLDSLQSMHDAFPVGTAVRCRSSTNNEDLPGFSGAGLYTSKTQHTDEGHISKSIKQVYASMWNFRAFEERDFYRVDHFVAAMGVLCHPNFKDEKSNGVGVTIDPIYDTDSTFYLNTQIGESLITNPDPNSVPEELLLFEDTAQGNGYVVLRLSNLAQQGQLVMADNYLDSMRQYMCAIHDEFEVLYDVVGVEGFGMDIEYKVTKDDDLAIKQARPWVSFWSNVKGDYDLSVKEIVNPQSSATLGNSEYIAAKIANTGLNDMYDFTATLYVDGLFVDSLVIGDTIKAFQDTTYTFSVPQDFSTISDYSITCIVTNSSDTYGNNDTLDAVVSKLHQLDGEIILRELSAVCNNEYQAEVVVKNQGAIALTSVEIKVLANGVNVNQFTKNVVIPPQGKESFTIQIDNSQAPTSNVLIELVKVNGQMDGDFANNFIASPTPTSTDYDQVTLHIIPDNFPEETSWEVIEESSGKLVANGSLSSSTSTYAENICLDFTKCYSLYMYDSYGDGMCCDYGNGYFFMLNPMGDTLLNNNGKFGKKIREVFCPDGTGCEIDGQIQITHTSSPSASDGEIKIYSSSGIRPFLYSIDNGITYIDSNSFTNLGAGIYYISVIGAAGICEYTEMVTIENCALVSANITVNNATGTAQTDGSISILPTSGIPPYQYSIDGGTNFSSTATYTGLPIGRYNVVIKDSLDICQYESTERVRVVPNIEIVEIDGFTHEILLFPNPTQGEFTIEIISNESLSEDVQLEVYDYLGRTLIQEVITHQGQLSKRLSLQHYESGTYFVRCHNSSFEKNFRIVKI